MAFRVPTFPLTCHVWRWFAGPYHPGGPVGGLISPAQLRVLKTAFAFGAVNFQAVVVLLVPKLTDIRGNLPTGSGSPDIVEVPAGSGRFYAAEYVDDVAKGFANEHRIAAIVPLVQPYPLP